jgi:hypothetical protein
LLREFWHNGFASMITGPARAVQARVENLVSGAVYRDRRNQ